jgi:hypothetical protein
MNPADGPDVITQGEEPDRLARWGAWAARRWAAVTVAALGIGLIAGYLAGHGQSSPSGSSPPAAAGPASPVASASPAPRPTVTITVPDLTATGNRCAVQHGTSLQLGVEVANQSDHAVVVGPYRAVLPIGGLKATGAAIGTCGALPAFAPASLSLPAGATEWLTITFHVLEQCPVPYPVQFVVSYTDAGKPATAQLDEFPDLGQVTYSGCPSTR